MGMIAFWSTLSSTSPTSPASARAQRAQIRGQSLGLPTTMTFFALLSVFVTSGSQAVYGVALWDPVQLVARTDNVFGLVFGLVTSADRDGLGEHRGERGLTRVRPGELAPKLISFRTGALITGVIGVVIMPWKLTETPELYIFTWLGLVGGLLGTVAGILIADYWIVRRTVL